ncbi:hypothetical protein ACFV3E_24665 [Streptomyces sp. NPDC059718]
MQERTDRALAQPSTAPQKGNDAPAIPDVVKNPPPPAPPQPSSVIGHYTVADCARDYAAAGHVREVLDNQIHGHR